MKNKQPPTLWTDWQTSQSILQTSNTNIWIDPPDIFAETLKKASKTNDPLTKYEKCLIGIK